VTFRSGCVIQRGHDRAMTVQPALPFALGWSSDSAIVPLTSRSSSETIVGQRASPNAATLVGEGEQHLASRAARLCLNQPRVSEQTHVAGQGRPVHNQASGKPVRADRPGQRQRAEQGELRRTQPDRRQRVIEVLGHRPRRPPQVEAGAR
jgi:hypothetical protein